ncbi:NupC/NupG family nucleoside CNT transporter [Nitrospirota bacterium]
MQNAISFIGIFILMLLAWAISTNRKIVNWRVVGWGLGIQLVFALFIFKVEAGALFFHKVNSFVISILDSASAGTRFLFGPLALPPGVEGSFGFVLAFQALPTIVFFSSLMALLYHFGVLPRIIKIFAKFFTKYMRISGAEALCAASNIFVGVEAATTIRPFLERMTRSELCTVLTVGMASIASSVMGFYVFILQGQFSNIAGHLVSASILSAPAAVIMSKLMVPETGEPVTLGVDVNPEFEKSTSAIESVIKGANEGLKLVFGVVALLLAFLGLVALADAGLSWAGGFVGMSELSIAKLLGFVFYPFALVIGVPPGDAMEVAQLIGQRAVVTEVKSYQDLAVMIEQGALEHPRSAVLAAYALCGFAHIASLAIFIGGIAALVPSRMADLSSLGLRALIAATLACLMTAAIAGTFFTQGSILLN